MRADHGKLITWWILLTGQKEHWKPMLLMLFHQRDMVRSFLTVYKAPGTLLWSWPWTNFQQDETWETKASPSLRLFDDRDGTAVGRAGDLGRLVRSNWLHDCGRPLLHPVTRLLLLCSTALGFGDRPKQHSLLETKHSATQEQQTQELCADLCEGHGTGLLRDKLRAASVAFRYDSMALK